MAWPSRNGTSSQYDGFQQKIVGDIYLESLIPPVALIFVFPFLYIYTPHAHVMSKFCLFVQSFDIQHVKFMIYSGQE